MDYNNPESFPPAKRMEFFKWYNVQVEKKVVFDFRKEMQAYCHSDVHLLRLGMQKLRTINYVTIAGVAFNGIFFLLRP